MDLRKELKKTISELKKAAEDFDRLAADYYKIIEGKEHLLRKFGSISRENYSRFLYSYKMLFEEEEKVIHRLENTAEGILKYMDNLKRGCTGFFPRYKFLPPALRKLILHTFNDIGDIKKLIYACKSRINKEAEILSTDGLSAIKYHGDQYGMRLCRNILNSFREEREGFDTLRNTAHDINKIAIGIENAITY